MYRNTLYEKIDNKTAKICVIGLGQVGLPTALTFGKTGFSVIGHDINKNLLSILNSKKSPFEEHGLELLLKTCIDNGKFNTTDNISEIIHNVDIVIVCVATPLTEDVKPDLAALENVCLALSEFPLLGKMIIIESSIPPGTFEGLVLPLLGKKNKFGQDCWAAFVPERLAPGSGLSEIQSTPRIIGHIDKESGMLAKLLYEKIVSSQIFITTVSIAEISKLVENTFRDVNVALANEIGLLCEHYGIDVTELIKVCNSHPRVKLLQPGPGVGGPCLPKDPYLLLRPQGGKQIDSKIILDSRKINDSMPYHVVDLIRHALVIKNKRPNESTISILGVTYKANVSDTRFSPSKEIISQLMKLGCNVIVFDPKTKETFGAKSASDIWNAISSSDVLVTVTDHDEFKNLDLIKIKKSMTEKPILVDTRRIFQRKEAEDLGFHYLAVGYVKNLTDK